MTSQSVSVEQVERSAHPLEIPAEMAETPSLTRWRVFQVLLVEADLAPVLVTLRVQAVRLLPACLVLHSVQSSLRSTVAGVRMIQLRVRLADLAFHSPEGTETSFQAEAARVPLAPGQILSLLQVITPVQEAGVQTTIQSVAPEDQVN